MTELIFTKASFLTDLPKIIETVKVLDDTKQYKIVIKQHHEKRSMDQNAYMWVLLGKLSAALRLPPEEIYQQLVRDVGGNYETMPIRDDAVDKWCEIWRDRGIGWVCDVVGPSKIKGYTNVICYYGSSTYDTAQMTRLLDLVIGECKQQDIETMTPDEMARMGWNNA